MQEHFFIDVAVVQVKRASYNRKGTEKQQNIYLLVVFFGIVLFFSSLYFTICFKWTHLAFEHFVCIRL